MRAPLSREGEHLHVAVAHASGERVGLVEQLDRPLEVALREERGDAMDHEQAPVLRRLGEGAEQALGVR